MPSPRLATRTATERYHAPCEIRLICVHADLNWIKENADQNSVFCPARVLILIVTGLSRPAGRSVGVPALASGRAV